MPTWREWRIGALHYLYFVPVGLPLALALNARAAGSRPRRCGASPRPSSASSGCSSLSEEFFFRGVLQQWIEDWTWSRDRRPAASRPSSSDWFTSGSAASSPTGDGSPSPPSSAGCCGRARNQAGSIRAGVVTHALVVATWRAFFA